VTFAEGGYAMATATLRLDPSGEIDTTWPG
jgi:hypothetical protein